MEVAKDSGNFYEAMLAGIREQSRIFDEECAKHPQRVYFIKAWTGHIKIGIALDPKKRLMELQIGQPRRLVLLGSCPGGPQLELALHYQFRRDRTSGEWFRPSPSLKARIAELLSPAAP